MAEYPDPNRFGLMRAAFVGVCWAALGAVFRDVTGLDSPQDWMTTQKAVEKAMDEGRDTPAWAMVVYMQEVRPMPKPNKEAFTSRIRVLAAMHKRMTATPGNAYRVAWDTVAFVQKHS